MSVSAPRPTPKAQRTRARILDRALGMFLDKGFEETSMRDIARAAGMSVGSTYYHFRGKDELILAWYERTQASAEERNAETCARTTSFAERLQDLLTFKLEQLGKARNLVVVLSRNGVDPRNRLSPFSAETAPIREAAIRLIADAIEGSDLAVDGALRPHLPRLLWMYQMGILLFWTYDPSPEQRRTRLLIERSLSLLLALVKLSTLRLPGVGKLRNQLLRVIEVFES